MWQKSLISFLHRFRRPFQSKQIIWHSSAHTTKPSNSNKAKPYWRAWSALDTKLNTNVAAAIAAHAESKSWMEKSLLIIFRSLLSHPEKFCRAAVGLLKTSNLIVGSASKSRIYLMSIYLKTNKKCRLNIVAEIFDFISTVQTAFCLSNLIYVRQPAKQYGRKIR